MGSLLGLTLVAAARSSSPDTVGAGTTGRSTPASTETTTDDGQAPAECDIPDGEPFVTGETVELTDLGEVDGAPVSAAVYPHPDYEGKPWSQWGQGMVGANGRFYYSAIGDHLAKDGYDPTSNTLTMIGDALSYVDHVPCTWGYGKIHSQMVPGPCGEIYFSTYWGSSRDLEFEGGCS